MCSVAITKREVKAFSRQPYQLDMWQLSTVQCSQQLPVQPHSQYSHTAASGPGSLDNPSLCQSVCVDLAADIQPHPGRQLDS